MTPTNPKTPSLRERIEYDLIDFYHEATRTAENGKWLKVLDKYKDQILLAVKEAMPEKCPNCAFTHLNPQICYGFNQAIEEMEKRCE